MPERAVCWACGLLSYYAHTYGLCARCERAQPTTTTTTEETSR